MRSLLYWLITNAYIASALASPVVDLGYARYQGTTIQDRVNGQTHTVFLGMRYAANPTGNLRFSAPKRPPVVPGITAATTDPPTCWQAAINFGGVLTLPSNETQAASSEDCLVVNVYVPGELGQRKKLPVVVWIHGGGYVLGDARSFDGNDIVRESGENVIAVIVQYRLGLFGFLSGQSVKDNGALNAGLLDQQFALQWVQENIAHFGGDRSRVTIWGESAGAGSVFQHVIANNGKTSPPLFRAAITSSLYHPPQYPFNHRIPENLYDSVVDQANCYSAQNTFTCLQNTDITVLENINVNITATGTWGMLAFMPVVDGTFIAKRPAELLQEGRLNTHVVLAVTNTFEGTIFVDDASATNLTSLAQTLYPDLGVDNTRAVAAMYAGLGDTKASADALLGDSIFMCPTYSFLQAVGKHTFKAEFAIPPAYHGTDIVYYFPTGAPDNLPPFSNPRFTSAFSGMFLDFVISQDPNKKTNSSSVVPLWSQWNGSNEMLFNKTDSGDADIRAITTSNKLLERCRFWNSVSGQTSQ